jgi:hypothetical protein
MSVWSGAAPPSAAVAAVRRSTDRLVTSVIEAVVADGSVYGEILDGPEGLAIRMGIEQAVRAFLDAIEHGARPSEEAADLWRRLGEAEFQSGRGLEELRAAFRTGTQAVWREAARLAADVGVPTEVVIQLAEAIFAYSDELAGRVVEGFLRMQSDEAGEIERRRRRLVALLLDPAGADPDALARAASLARWQVPRSVAVLAVAGQDPLGPIGRRLGVDALIGADTDGGFLIVPDPEGPARAREIDTAVEGVDAALGPPVPPAASRRSLRRARLALTLLERGALHGPTGRLARADEHLVSLVTLQDADLAEEFAAARLAVVEALPVAERDRLLETLSEWLALQRHVPAIAESLHVHPQTVRYRVARLRELLGPTLEDPDGRFELQLALRIRHQLGASGSSGSASSSSVSSSNTARSSSRPPSAAT